MSSGHDEQDERQIFLQQKVTTELLNTEMAYVGQLNGLLNGLIGPMLSAAKRTKDSAATDILTQGNNTIGPIFGMNSRLLRDLKKQLKNPLILSKEQVEHLKASLKAATAAGTSGVPDYSKFFKSIKSEADVCANLGMRDMALESFNRDVATKLKEHKLSEILGVLSGLKALERDDTKQITTHEFTKRPYGFVVVQTPAGHIVAGITDKELKRKIQDKSKISAIGDTQIAPDMRADAIKKLLETTPLPVRIKFEQKSTVKGCLIIVLSPTGEEIRKVSLAKGIPKTLRGRRKICSFVADKLEIPKGELRFPEHVSNSMHRLTLTKVEAGENTRTLVPSDRQSIAFNLLERKSSGGGVGGVARPVFLVGQVFREIAPFLRIYTPYVTFYQSFLDFFRKLVDTKRNWTLLQKLESAKLPMPYQQLIITPIQRVPRYKLLLNELLKHTESGHPDYDDLKFSLEMVSKVAAEINENIKKQTARATLVAIQRKFEGGVQLISPSRRFIRTGEVTILDAQNPVFFHDIHGLSADSKTIPGVQSITLFLFNDLLIQAVKSGNHKYSLLRWISLDTIEDVAHADVLMDRNREANMAKRIAKSKGKKKRGSVINTHNRKSEGDAGSGNEDMPQQGLLYFRRHKKSMSEPSCRMWHLKQARRAANAATEAVAAANKSKKEGKDEKVGGSVLIEEKKNKISGGEDPVRRMSVPIKGSTDKDVKEKQESWGLATHFLVILDRQSFVVGTKSLKEKGMWMSDFIRCIDERRQTIQGQQAQRRIKKERSHRSVLLASVAPVWQADESSNECNVCSKRFHMLTRRRHHCRYCGLLVCDSCSKHRRMLPDRRNPHSGEEMRRVCKKCVKIIDAMVPRRKQNQSTSMFRLAVVPPRRPRKASIGAMVEAVNRTQDISTIQTLANLMVKRGNLSVTGAKMFLDQLHQRRVRRMRKAEEAEQRTQRAATGYEHETKTAPTNKPNHLSFSSYSGTDVSTPRNRAKRYKICRMMYDFTGEDDQELTLKRGDVVQKVDTEVLNAAGWYSGCFQGKTGYFPARYAEIIGGEEKKSSKKAMARRRSSQKWFIAKFKFESSATDVLTLQEGDKVKVVAKDKSGWWWGINPATKAKGWFPSSYAIADSTPLGAPTSPIATPKKV
ncbi:hypothetical protein AAMO2058_001034400 [Amorphochlora amoebiformis]